MFLAKIRGELSCYQPIPIAADTGKKMRKVSIKIRGEQELLSADLDRGISETRMKPKVTDNELCHR